MLTVKLTIILRLTWCSIESYQYGRKFKFMEENFFNRHLPNNTHVSEYYANIYDIGYIRAVEALFLAYGYAVKIQPHYSSHIAFGDSGGNHGFWVGKTIIRFWCIGRSTPVQNI